MVLLVPTHLRQCVLNGLVTACLPACLPTFSSMSSIASSLSFSLPPFFKMLSQNVASSSALLLALPPLLQNPSNAPFRAWGWGGGEEMRGKEASGMN